MNAFWGALPPLNKKVTLTPSWFIFSHTFSYLALKQGALAATWLQDHIICQQYTNQMAELNSILSASVETPWGSKHLGALKSSIQFNNCS